MLTDERPIDGARAPPLLPCAADEFRFLDASVSDRRSRSLFCKGAARSNPSNRGDPFLASLRAIMGEGGMDKSAPPGAAARPPGAEGTVHVRQVISNAGDSLAYADLHFIARYSNKDRSETTSSVRASPPLIASPQPQNPIVCECPQRRGTQQNTRNPVSRSMRQR